MAKRTTKSAAKQVAYDQAMRSSQKKTASAPKWVKHFWDETSDSLVTQSRPGFFPRPGLDWHRQGSLDDLEARENAGQREMF